MKTIVNAASALVLFVGAQAALASNPVEFWGCKFNEGKGMADLMAWTEEWNTVVDALPDDGYNA